MVAAVLVGSVPAEAAKCIPDPDSGSYQDSSAAGYNDQVLLDMTFSLSGQPYFGVALNTPELLSGQATLLEPDKSRDETIPPQSWWRPSLLLSWPAKAGATHYRLLLYDPPYHIWTEYDIEWFEATSTSKRVPNHTSMRAVWYVQYRVGASGHPTDLGTVEIRCGMDVIATTGGVQASFSSTNFPAHVSSGRPDYGDRYLAWNREVQRILDERSGIEDPKDPKDPKDPEDPEDPDDKDPGGGDPDPGTDPDPDPASDSLAFSRQTYTFTLDEGVSGREFLGRVKATDPEGLPITYALISGNRDRFSVEAESGRVIYTGPGEDFEDGPGSYTLRVSATNSRGKSVTARVTVRIVDVNEGPAFEAATYAFTLEEGVSEPTVLGRVRARDPEGDALTYELSVGDGTRFAVDAESGEVSYIGPGEDFESGFWSYALRVSATDSDGIAATAGVTVRILDVNEGPVFESEKYAFTLDEGVSEVTTLGRVSASDPDGDPVSYTLSVGDPGRFAVDAGSGEVTYTGPGEDFESGPASHALKVTASDPEGEAAAAPVVVTVINVDDPGAVALTSLALLVGQAVQAELTDPDGGVADVAWSWEWATTGDFVSIAGATAASYTPGTDAVGRRLRAVARYADAQGGGKRSVSEATAPVRLDEAQRAAAVKASLASFGRTVATATVQAVEDRFEGTRSAGQWRASLGGVALRPGIPGEEGGQGRWAGTLRSLGSLFGVTPATSTAQEPGNPHGNPQAGLVGGGGLGGGSSAMRRRMLRDRLFRSSFELGIGGQAPEEGEASGLRPGVTVWGRGDVSGFDGGSDGLSLAGDMLTLLVGSDYRWSPKGLAGVAVTRAQGSISYTSSLAGEAALDAGLVTVQPYVYLSPRENLGIWGLAGIGRGGLDLADAEYLGASALAADLAARLGAAGVRQGLASTGPVSWAVKADGLFIGLSTTATEGLPTVEATGTRLRAAVEGRTAMEVGESLHLTPSFEVGARHDGGDADTGAGLELGGGLSLDHLPTGVSLRSRVRYLVAHQAEAFEEWGAAFTLRVDRGRAGRGLALTLSPSWGEAHGGGTQALWMAERQLARHVRAGRRQSGGLTLRQEVSYGFDLGGGGLVAPLAGVDQDGWGGRRLRAGARVALSRAGGAGLHLDVLGEQLTRQLGQPDYGVGVFGTWNFGGGPN